MVMAYMTAPSSGRGVAVHGDLAPAARVARAAEHADAVEVHGDVAGAVESDDAAFTAGAAQLHLDHLAHRLRQSHVAVVQQRARVVRDHLADEVLALARAGYRTGLVAGVGARADEGGIADPAVVLVGKAAGGGGRREVALAVERHGADRTH